MTKVSVSPCLAIWFVVLALVSGCAASTKLVRNDKAPHKEYQDVYFLKPEKDPRSVGPRVVAELEAMGLTVHQVEPGKPVEGGQGTGFVATADGHVLTCAHVLADAKEARVWIGGVRYEADVVASDNERDIALLKIRPSAGATFAPLAFRRDAHYAIGTDVSTIGYPLASILGSSARFTKGSVSATAGMNDDPKHLQISAEIQPGNSGGPVFDGDGLVIGLVDMTLNPMRVAAQTGGALPQNVNFALKSEVVLDYLKTSQPDVYERLTYDQGRSTEGAQAGVAKVRGGIVSREWESKPKAVVTIQYVSIWDMWYRFRQFIVTVWDFDTHEVLFAAGQGRDDIRSNEDVVIKDTFAQIRKGLGK